MTALQTKIISLREGRTVPRNPPAYNPQSNGPCEKAVQDVTAHFRAIKFCLEYRLGREIEASEKIIEWALPHSAYLLSRFSVGHDGMTPYERTTGRKWRRPLVEFGELVLAKLALRRVGHGKTKRQKKKLVGRSIEAVWVGQVGRTGEHIVVKPSGDAVRCRTGEQACRRGEGRRGEASA